MVFLPTKVLGYKVPKWTPQKVFLQNNGFEEKPGGKGGVLVHGRICEKYHLWKIPGGKGGALSTGGFVRRIIFGKIVCFQK